MLTIAGKQFAETEAEVTASLFNPAGSVVGKAKRSRNVIHLHRLNGELCGAVTRGGVIGAARALEDGKTWYSYGDCPLIGELRCSQMAAEVEALAVSSTYTEKGRTYRFR